MRDREGAVQVSYLSADEVRLIERQARQEVADEDRRAAVERTKERIRARRARPWWRLLFPFKITIRRI